MSKTHTNSGKSVKERLLNLSRAEHYNPQMMISRYMQKGCFIVCPLGLAKGLYTEEEFEYEVINAVVNLDNVLFWHRNSSRTGFCINGYINHYPNFIVQLNSGITVLLETKGDDRDNSDSRTKVELGRTWANKAGEQYRFFMVFDKQEMEGGCYDQRAFAKIKRNVIDL